MTEKLVDRWHSRDFPVLVAAAQRLESNGVAFLSNNLSLELKMTTDDVGLALAALVPSHLEGERMESAAAGPCEYVVTGITERGRRATGLWPDQEQAADALIELLTQAADHVDDDEDAGALRKAGRLLRSVPGAVLADVTAALIRQQAGLR